MARSDGPIRGDVQAVGREMTAGEFEIAPGVIDVTPGDSEMAAVGVEVAPGALEMTAVDCEIVAGGS